jgi:hypothetical protein
VEPELSGNGTLAQWFNVVIQSWYGQPGWYEWNGSPPFLTVNGYANVSVMQGTMAIFTVSSQGGGVPIMLLHNIPDLAFMSGILIPAPNDPSFTYYRAVDMVNILKFGFYDLPEFSSYVYTANVTGQGTRRVVFDTTHAPPGTYYLVTASQIGNYHTHTLLVQVQSPTPITVNISSSYYASVLGVFGDIYVIAQIEDMSDPNMRLFCGPDDDVHDAGAFQVATGVGGITFDSSVLIGLNTRCCWLRDSTWFPYVYFFFKDRLRVATRGTTTTSAVETTSTVQPTTTTEEETTSTAEPTA